MDTRNRLFTIGEVAECCDVTVASIRYYEEVGLLTPTARVGGKRRFNDEVIGRLVFIRKAQAVGFSLDEIRTLLVGDDDWQNLVATRLDELRERRRKTDELITILEDIERCHCDTVLTCADHGPAELTPPKRLAGDRS